MDNASFDYGPLPRALCLRHGEQARTDARTDGGTDARAAPDPGAHSVTDPGTDARADAGHEPAAAGVV